MANTPSGSWAACSHFGLRDLLEQSNTRGENVQTIVGEMNRALKDLRIVDFQVESVSRDSTTGAEVGRWTVTLVSTADPAKTFSVGLDDK